MARCRVGRPCRLRIFWWFGNQGGVALSRIRRSWNMILFGLWNTYCRVNQSQRNGKAVNNRFQMHIRRLCKWKVSIWIAIDFEQDGQDQSSDSAKESIINNLGERLTGLVTTTIRTFKERTWSIVGMDSAKSILSLPLWACARS